MGFLEIARRRFASRKYLDKPVEEDKLHRILEAGRIAPSAANYQPWEFIILRKQRSILYEVYKREWFKTAPVVIVICGDHLHSWRRGDEKDHMDIDVAIATDHMTLEAADLGLATCWVCNFDKKRCSEILGLPEHIEPVVILPLGYPADHKEPDRHAKERKSLSEIIHMEKY
ncbi:MAG: nitroreductase family protein [Bacteroidetes bacterium]|nr:nitroreductase family protein [Bacteroidota bacterium]